MTIQLILEELQGLFAWLPDEKIDALAEKVAKAPRVFTSLPCSVAPNFMKLSPAAAASVL